MDANNPGAASGVANSKGKTLDPASPQAASQKAVTPQAASPARVATTSPAAPPTAAAAPAKGAPSTATPSSGTLPSGNLASGNLASGNLASGKLATKSSGQPYFSIRDIHAYYGESYIVQGVTFDVSESEIVALLGRNGAGKTTLLRTIARTVDPQLKSGEIYLQGKAVHKMASHQAACNGIQLVPEDRRIIPGLTVEENIQLAQIAEPIGWTLERIYKHFPRLDERRKQEAITLSGGEQQMLAIARALARDLKLLLLDEPYEGLAPVIVQEIERILVEVKELGITTIIVEQNAVAALQLADRALILDMGQIVYQGSAKEVLDNEALRHEYLAI